MPRRCMKAEDFDCEKYEALDGVCRELTNKALKALEDMDLLEDTEETAIAVAAMAAQIKKSETVETEEQKKINNFTQEQINSIETKKKVQTFNFYEYYMKKMGNRGS